MTTGRSGPQLESAERSASLGSAWHPRMRPEQTRTRKSNLDWRRSTVATTSSLTQPSPQQINRPSASRSRPSPRLASARQSVNLNLRCRDCQPLTAGALQNAQKSVNERLIFSEAFSQGAVGLKSPGGHFRRGAAWDLSPAFYLMSLIRVLPPRWPYRPHQPVSSISAALDLSGHPVQPLPTHLLRNPAITFAVRAVRS